MKKTLSVKEQQQLIELLKNRFEQNMQRHKNVIWDDVQQMILSKPEMLWSLQQMEATGGEPDIIILDKNKIVFVDCSKESPSGRRSWCYDKAAWEARKMHKPDNNAIDVAASMGIELLSEDEYRLLQKTDKYDLKTSSWVRTPEAIRKLGGALFCDRRYDTVFTYHNGADSYYAARGFRGKLEI